MELPVNNVVEEDDELNEELLEVFDKDFLVSALEEAERCTAFFTPEELRARMDKILNSK